MIVCGATGFVGRNVATHFAQDRTYEVVGVHNRRPPFQHPSIRWVKADLTRATDVEMLLADGADVIVQAAATTSGSRDIVERPQIHVTDNAVMNSLIFRSAFERKVKHVIFFSCTVMLPSSDRGLTEQDFDANRELHPRYFGVGWTKLYAEKMCEFYSRIGSTKYTAIRHSNVYGPHDKFDLERSHVLGASITKVMTARDGKVTIWGAGEESRDLLYVGDLVGFVSAAIENQKSAYGLYNCGYGEAITINDLVRRIVRVSGKALKIEHDLAKPSIKTSLFLDCSKALSELGWRRRTSIDDGLKKTIDWWHANQCSSGTSASSSPARPA
jgi:nucleoside-diphosphate-sugar epimerase